MPPLARRQRRGSASEGPRGARRATTRGSPDQHSSFVTQMDALPAVLSPAGSSATPVHPNGRLRLRTAACPECCARRGKGGWWKRDSMRELFTTRGCHDRRLLQHGQAAGALARATAGGAILARSPARTQRPRRHALRALRPSSRFAPSFVLCPGPLVATLWMQWRYQARLGDPSGSWTAVTSRPLAQKTPPPG